MTDIFLPYKREDETRVGRLVQALEKAGLKVWWDRGLPAGESWRANIRCGPFVRPEDRPQVGTGAAGAAKRSHMRARRARVSADAAEVVSSQA
ncbi:toll/interleukin-1 receptor domain-containing protein [Candidatus Viadribacter manganicus]|uniref:TIR domain-containing protein n=1 Tax=Candidatus Viadribacter manganicus TaxID=1759059 RepID=UPI0009F72A5C